MCANHLYVKQARNDFYICGEKGDDQFSWKIIIMVSKALGEG